MSPSLAQLASTMRWMVGVSTVVWSSGCVTMRDYADPRQRLTDGTAYGLTHREVRIDSGVVGTEVADVGANLDVATTVVPNVQVSTNLAHMSLGLVNAGVKYTALDRPWLGLGLEAGFLWTRPSLIWLLPDDIADPLRNIDLLVVPVKATASVPVARWTSLHLGLAYTHAEITGELRGDSDFFDAGIGARVLQVDPTFHFYLDGRAALILGGNLPLTMTVAERVESEVELEEGVVLGVQSAEWVRIPVRDAMRGWLGVEVRFGRRTHVQLFVARNVLASARIGPPVLPSLNLYWRI